MLLATAPMLMTTPTGRPWRLLAEVVAAAKARPETITYGTVGAGSLAHLTMEVLQQRAGFRLIHVPYRGGGPLATAAVAGEVDLAIASRVGLGGQVGTQLRALAQSGAKRSPALPDLPTLAESGFPERRGGGVLGHARPGRRAGRRCSPASMRRWPPGWPSR